jgi:hypothetical protein
MQIFKIGRFNIHMFFLIQVGQYLDVSILFYADYYIYHIAYFIV